MKGVRQGCPMSPLLFILTMEVFLNQIRQRKEIIGLKSKKEEYKVQVFAVDLVFFVEAPMESGTYLVQELEEYGAAAGLKINKDKTKLITKNLTESQKKDLERKWGLQNAKKFKYLGIWLTGRCSSIKEDNYTKLLTQI
uniref:Reverse transcriptase domain-containing protein n=1 Tax=Micrurus surinamensis TaxID=129470 RepID=A0A2D4PTK3_MICSU